MAAQMYGAYYASLNTEGGITQEQFDERVAELNAKRAARQTETDARYAGFAQNAIDQVMHNLYGDEWDIIKDWYVNGNMVDMDSFIDGSAKNIKGNWSNMFRTLESFGTMASVAGYGGLYSGSGYEFEDAFWNANKEQGMAAL